MVRNILQDAIEARSSNYLSPSRNGAATSFLSIVDTALEYFAKHANHRPYIANLIVNGENYRDEKEQRDISARQEFVERMKAAKRKAECLVA